MTRNRETSCRTDSVPAGGVPGCDTGPVGRVAFVTRELADLWRELRGSTTGNARLTPDQDTEKDTDK